MKLQQQPKIKIVYKDGSFNLPIEESTLQKKKANSLLGVLPYKGTYSSLPEVRSIDYKKMRDRNDESTKIIFELVKKLIDEDILSFDRNALIFKKLPEKSPQFIEPVVRDKEIHNLHNRKNNLEEMIGKKRGTFFSSVNNGDDRDGFVRRKLKSGNIGNSGFSSSMRSNDRGMGLGMGMGFGMGAFRPASTLGSKKEGNSFFNDDGDSESLQRKTKRICRGNGFFESGDGPSEVNNGGSGFANFGSSGSKFGNAFGDPVQPAEPGGGFFSSSSLPQVPSDPVNNSFFGGGGTVREEKMGNGGLNVFNSFANQPQADNIFGGFGMEKNQGLQQITNSIEQQKPIENNSFFNTPNQAPTNFASSYNQNPGSYSKPGCFASSSARLNQDAPAASFGAPSGQAGGFFQQSNDSIAKNERANQQLYDELKTATEFLKQRPPSYGRNPCLMFNEPHYPVILPTISSFEGDYRDFKTVLDTYNDAKRIVKKLEKDINSSRVDYSMSTYSKFKIEEGVKSWYEQENPLNMLRPKLPDWMPKRSRKPVVKDRNPLLRQIRQKARSRRLEKTKDLKLLEKARLQSSATNRETDKDKLNYDRAGSTMSLSEPRTKTKRINLPFSDKKKARDIIDTSESLDRPTKQPNIIINFDSSSSSCLNSEDEDSHSELHSSFNSLEDETKPYEQIYSIPSATEISKMTANERRSIENLKLFNKYGKITFLKPVDLTFIRDIKDVVIIKRAFIDFYPEESNLKIPEPGKGLNQPFILTFNDLFTGAKGNYDISDSIRIFEEKMKKFAKKIGAKFIEFDIEWNATKLFVEHL